MWWFCCVYGYVTEDYVRAHFKPLYWYVVFCGHIVGCGLDASRLNTGVRTKKVFLVWNQFLSGSSDTVCKWHEHTHMHTQGLRWRLKINFKFFFSHSVPVQMFLLTSVWIYILLLCMYTLRQLLRNISFLIMITASSGSEQECYSMGYEYLPDSAGVPLAECGLKPSFFEQSNWNHYCWASIYVDGCNLHPGGSQTLRSALNSLRLA